MEPMMYRFNYACALDSPTPNGMLARIVFIPFAPAVAKL
jgi:hypothetical protein